MISIGRREILTCFTIVLLVTLIFFTTSNTDSYYQALFPSSSSSSSSQSQQQQNSSPATTSSRGNSNKNVDETSPSIDQLEDNTNNDFSFRSPQQSKTSSSTSSNSPGVIHPVFEPRKYFSSIMSDNNNQHERHHHHPPRRPFRFHIYKLPSQYVEGALEALKQTWHVSICNRGKKKSNFTMLDWRHAHSLFTADVFITRFMRLHPQHTENLDEADAFIIPMMSHLYNCAGKMSYQIDILSMIYAKYYKNYKEMEHRDHYLFWWRWGMHFGGVQKFWRRVTKYFPNVNLISFDLLEIMGRNQFQDFNLALKPKFDRNLLNIIMPYPDFSPALMNHIAKYPLVGNNNNNNNNNKNEIHERKRDIFFYFSGTSTIGGIRRWIKWNCDKEDSSKNNNNNNMRGCVFVDFATSVTDLTRLGVPTSYPQAMLDSVFCGHAAGDALSSRRPTSAILAGCIPVLICDLCLYAFESQIDYTSFAVFVPESEVIAGNLVSILQKVYANKTYVKMLRDNLNSVRDHFVYHEGKPQEGDALDMLAKELEMRGLLMRQYRRWFQINAALSSDLKDYPVEPPNSVKKYVRREKDGTVDQKDAKDFPNRPLLV